MGMTVLVAPHDTHWHAAFVEDGNNILVYGEDCFGPPSARAALDNSSGGVCRRVGCCCVSGRFDFLVGVGRCVDWGLFRSPVRQRFPTPSCVRVCVWNRPACLLAEAGT